VSTTGRDPSRAGSVEGSRSPPRRHLDSEVDLNVSVAQTPIQNDLALWQTLHVRRRREKPLKGVDAAANRWVARARHARRGHAFLHREARAIEAWREPMEAMTDRELDEQVVEVRQGLALRRVNPELDRRAFAVVREIASRMVGKRPYHVQLMGALGLYHGQIVEMVTGEGKTLTAAVASVMLAWRRLPVHVITVNDYLAARDAENLAPLYHRAGLTVGSVGGETAPADRIAGYRHAVVYTTQKELVADWLRDHLAMGQYADAVSTRWRLDSGGAGASIIDRITVPALGAAVVDEIDAILIDEAVTPLIIAQPRGEEEQAALYRRARELSQTLEKDRHYTVDAARRRVELTASGKRALREQLDEAEHELWLAQRRREEMVVQALVAEHCYHEGQHYQIVEDRIVLVDEYTGRFMQDREWQHGLHQATEVKHDLEVTAERDTLASMSFQRFFRQYPHLCGMTGTAADARPELEATYGLPVRVIPTNRPIQRMRLPDLIFARSDDRWRAVVDEVRAMHDQRRPVLIGTRSVAASEQLSELLEAQGLEHRILNAVHHEAEAGIIAEAGRPGAVTVATNMAGRGTDILLGQGVASAGGLHVILTERHTSRRVDRQLFGRSGRQGDPGSARCIVSLEDDLVVKYTPRLSAALRRRFRRSSGPLPRWTGMVFDKAQRRAQSMSFRSRLNTLRHEQELDRVLPS